MSGKGIASETEAESIGGVLVEGYGLTAEQKRETALLLGKLIYLECAITAVNAAPLGTAERLAHLVAQRDAIAQQLFARDKQDHLTFV